MKEYNLKQQKAINSLLYVISKLEKADTHKTYKILYFADQKHLVRYGRPIIGDTYVKMPYVLMKLWKKISYYHLMI